MLHKKNIERFNEVLQDIELLLHVFKGETDTIRYLQELLLKVQQNLNDYLKEAQLCDKNPKDTHAASNLTQSWVAFFELKNVYFNFIKSMKAINEPFSKILYAKFQIRGENELDGIPYDYESAMGVFHCYKNDTRVLLRETASSQHWNAFEEIPLFDLPEVVPSKSFFQRNKK